MGRATPEIVTVEAAEAPTVAEPRVSAPFLSVTAAPGANLTPAPPSRSVTRTVTARVQWEK